MKAEGYRFLDDPEGEIRRLEVDGHTPEQRRILAAILRTLYEGGSIAAWPKGERMSTFTVKDPEHSPA